MLRTFTIEMWDSVYGDQTTYRPTSEDIEDLLNEHGPACVRFKVLNPGDECKSPTFIQFHR